MGFNRDRTFKMLDDDMQLWEEDKLDYLEMFVIKGHQEVSSMSN